MGVPPHLLLWLASRIRQNSIQMAPCMWFAYPHYELFNRWCVVQFFYILGRYRMLFALVSLWVFWFPKTRQGYVVLNFGIVPSFLVSPFLWIVEVGVTYGISDVMVFSPSSSVLLPFITVRHLSLYMNRLWFVPDTEGCWSGSISMRDYKPHDSHVSLSPTSYPIPRSNGIITESSFGDINNTSCSRSVLLPLVISYFSCLVRWFILSHCTITHKNDSWCSEYVLSLGPRDKGVSYGVQEWCCARWGIPLQYVASTTFQCKSSDVLLLLLVISCRIWFPDTCAYYNWCSQVWEWLSSGMVEFVSSRSRVFLHNFHG